MERASVVSSAWVKALSGTDVDPLEDIEVFGVVVPPLAGEPEVEEAGVIALAGAVNTPEVGVYFTEVVSAFDPAEADAEDEKDVAAPAPLAPADPLAWMYRDPRLAGFWRHSGAVSRTTWYWFNWV